jgi:hypothetical protein
MTKKTIVKTVFGFLGAAFAVFALVVVNVGALTQNTNSSTTTDPQNANSSTTADAPQENTGGGVNEDLSGTYAGRVTMTGGHEMSGDATLTITSNTFTLEAGGMTHRGRVYAVNTRRYIGAAFYFDDLTDDATKTPLAASVRVRRRGNAISLTPVPGSRNRLTFTGRSTG